VAPSGQAIVMHVPFENSVSLMRQRQAVTRTEYRAPEAARSPLYTSMTSGNTIGRRPISR